MMAALAIDSAFRAALAGLRRAENAPRTLSEHDKAAPPAGPAARVTVAAKSSGLGVGRRRPSKASTGAEAAMDPSTMWGYLSLSHAAEGSVQENVDDGKQAGMVQDRSSMDGSFSSGERVLACVFHE